MTIESLQKGLDLQRLIGEKKQELERLLNVDKKTGDLDINIRGVKIKLKKSDIQKEIDAQKTKLEGEIADLEQEFNDL